MPRLKPGDAVHGPPGHPLHPPLTDLTIGAYAFAMIAAVLSKVGIAEHGFATAWWLALAVGLCSSVFTVGSGLVEWLTISRGTPLWSSATVHAVVMAAASVLFVLAVVLGHGSYTAGSLATGPFVLTVAGFVVLLVGGWLGGALTYVYGMRVLGLPKEPALHAASPVPDQEEAKAAN